ncbi:TatD family hydrolase [Vibrio sp. FNV 38]|nr:TatD family hydrolase [Vibrio sp. FNV 38]
MFLIEKTLRSMTEYPLFDTHCHLDFDVFTANFETQLTRATDANVKRLLIPSIGPQNWEAVHRLASTHCQIDWALGYHPYYLTESATKGAHQLVQRYQQFEYKPLAIGECGLDSMVDTNSKIQQQILQAHIASANELNLPVVLHCRKSHSDLLHIIKRNPVKRGGVLHGFSGSYELAMQFVEKGFFIGVGGVITYPRAQKSRTAITRLPLEYMVLETDSPDMPLYGFQGSPNHPEHLNLILNTICDLKQIERQTIARKIWENSISLF